MIFRAVKVGEWFEANGRFFIKTVPFMRGPNACYEAVDLMTGEPAFVTDVSINACQECVMVRKPDWLKLETEVPMLERWSVRYDTEQGRNLGKLRLQNQFPGIKVKEEDLDGALLLVADVMPEVHGEIKQKFGGS